MLNYRLIAVLYKRTFNLSMILGHRLRYCPPERSSTLQLPRQQFQTQLEVSADKYFFKNGMFYI
jgi:hypothetical protein